MKTKNKLNISILPLLLPALMLFGFKTRAQVFNWVAGMGGNGSYYYSYDHPNSMALLPSGSVYTTGYFMSYQPDFDPGSGTFFLTNSGGSEAFISKLLPNGTFGWAKRFDSTGSCSGVGICTDAAGNLYVTGSFAGTKDFNPGSGTFSFTTSSANSDLFICKLDSNGNFVWARQIRATPYVAPVALALDVNGNIYINGLYTDSVDMDPGAATSWLHSAGSGNVFLLKLNNSGNFVWAKSIGGTSTINPTAMAIDPGSNIILTGEFRGSADFDPGAATYSLTTTSGNPDAYICKLSSAGSFVWARNLGGIGWEHPNAITTDSSGNILSAGWFLTADSNDFDPGPGTAYLYNTNTQNDAYISKLNSSGNFVWAKQFRATHQNEPTALQTDLYGNLYITGFFKDSIDLDPGPAKFTLGNNGSKDVFLCKLNSNGVFRWGLKMGDGNSNDVGTALQRHSSGAIYTTGYYSNYTYFDPPNGGAVPFYGQDDIFVTRHSGCNNSYVTKPIAACVSYTSPSGRFTWTTNGTYSDTILSVAGCDSIITINLTIKQRSNSSFNVAACDKYVSPSGKFIWTTSGTYKDTIPNAAGCDSAMTIQLVIKKSSQASFSVTACDKYVSPSGKYTWTTSGVKRDTLTNAAGCDSIILINLTIKKSTSSAITRSACYHYLSPSGKNDWTTSGVYRDTIPNYVGCDSIITVTLTILQRTYTNVNVQRCGSYQSPSGKYTWANSGSYQDTLTGASGCDSVLNIAFTSYPLPSASFSVNNASQCLNGNSFLFTDNSTVSAGTLSRLWFLGYSGSDTSSLATINRNYNNTGAYTVKLICTSDKGCADSMSKVVNVHPQPVPVFSVFPDSVVCADVTVQLKTTTTDAITWLKNGSAVGTPSDTLNVHNAPGAYALRLTNSFNCSATSAPVSLTFKLIPAKPVITFSNDTLISSASAGNQWYNSAGLISGATGQKYVLSTPGDYYDIVTLNGCSSPAADVVHFTGVGIGKAKPSPGFVIFPNPTTGNFTIQLQKPGSEKITVRLLDMSGKEISKQVFEPAAELQMEQNGLSNGVYVLQISTSTLQQNTQLVIAR